MSESTEPHPCGHATITAGCGGCDPSAIEFVIDGGTMRAFDPALDLRPADLAPAPEPEAHTHTLMMASAHNGDGRVCGRHSRLGIWLSLNESYAHGQAMQCLRPHDDGATPSEPTP